MIRRNIGPCPECFAAVPIMPRPGPVPAGSVWHGRPQGRIGGGLAAESGREPGCVGRCHERSAMGDSLPRCLDMLVRIINPRPYLKIPLFSGERNRYNARKCNATRILNDLETAMKQLMKFAPHIATLVTARGIARNGPRTGNTDRAGAEGPAGLRNSGGDNPIRCYGHWHCLIQQRGCWGQGV